MKTGIDAPRKHEEQLHPQVEERGEWVWGGSEETPLSDNTGDWTINRSDSLSEWKFADQATDVRGGFCFCFFPPAQA